MSLLKCVEILSQQTVKEIGEQLRGIDEDMGEFWTGQMSGESDLTLVHFQRENQSCKEGWGRGGRGSKREGVTLFSFDVSLSICFLRLLGFIALMVLLWQFMGSGWWRGC